MTSPAEPVLQTSLRRQLIQGVTGIAALKLTNIVLTLIVGAILARALKPEGYGIYSFALSLATLLGLPSHAGLPVLVMRETAKSQLNRQWGMLRGLLTFSNAFAILTSLITAFIAMLVTWIAWGGATTPATTTFSWALLLLPFLAFGNLRAGTLRGLRKAVSGQFPELFVRPLVMSILIGPLWLLGHSISPDRAMQLQALSVFVAFITGALLLKVALPTEIHRTRPDYAIKSWTASLLSLSALAATKTADSQVTIILLGLLSTNTDVAYYRVAIQGAGLVAFGLTSANLVLAPIITRLYHDGKTERLQQVITKSTRFVMAVSIPVFLAFALFGEQLLTLLFGEEFSGAAFPLAILCAGQLINASAGSVGLVLNMTGNEKDTLRGVFIGLLVNITLSLVLIPIYGVTGAAIGTTASFLSWNIILIRATYRKTGINTFFLARNNKLKRS